MKHTDTARVCDYMILRERTSNGKGKRSRWLNSGLSCSSLFRFILLGLFTVAKSSPVQIDSLGNSSHRVRTSESPLINNDWMCRSELIFFLLKRRQGSVTLRTIIGSIHSKRNVVIQINFSNMMRLLTLHYDNNLLGRGAPVLFGQTRS